MNTFIATAIQRQGVMKHRHALIARQPCTFSCELLPGIDHGNNVNTCVSERMGNAICAVVVCRNGYAFSRRHRVAVTVLLHGARQHDAGAVVIGEDQRLLNSAGGEHNLTRMDLP